MNITGALEPTIIYRILRSYRDAFFGGCYQPRIRNPTCRGFTNNVSQGQYGYGVANGACSGMVVEEAFFDDCRHGYTTAAVSLEADETDHRRLLGSGRSIGGHVSGRGRGGTSSQFDTHHCADGVGFGPLEINDTGGHAQTFRGRGIHASDVRIRNCANGVSVFTEYQSGDPNDDLWVAGKPEGLTTAYLSRYDVETTGVPLYEINAVRELVVTSSRFVTSKANFLTGLGSNVILHDCKFVVSDFDGAAPISAVSADVCFSMDEATAEIQSDTGTRVVFEGNITIDLRALSSCGQTNLIVFQPGANAIFHFMGRVQIILPNGIFAKIFDNSIGGMFTATPDSNVVISVDGAADNSVTTGAAGNQLKFEFADGSGCWDTTGLPTLRDLKLMFRDGTVGVTHNGTGSQAENIYILPKGAINEMNVEGNAMRLRLRGRKTGTNGAGDVQFVWGGQFNFQFGLPASAVEWEIDVIALMTGISMQSMTGHCAYWTAGTVGSAKTETAINATETVNLGATLQNWRIRGTFASSDSFIIDVAEMWASKVAYGVS